VDVLISWVNDTKTAGSVLAADGSWYAPDGESFYCCSKLNLQMLGKDDAL
jgi:hypothetical protein